MYSYDWDPETGGYLMNSTPLQFSKEPRPVYYRELDILKFDQYWQYEKQDERPYMWAEANSYWYRGRKVAQTKGGSLYCAPEVVILEEPEPNGAPLRPVDIDEMVRRNHDFMQGFVQETIRKVYNTWQQYRDKVDVFYVAFSGGKDSIVALDIVQNALPHDAFMVIFGNTQMEFPTTKDYVDVIEENCKKSGIRFYRAIADVSAKDTWEKFGPPARNIRYCCTILKTAPVINLLSQIVDKKRMRSMMITGVRGDESVSRSEYDELSMGKKLAGQYSFHPILDWSSAEIWLQIYSQNLPINSAYKFGFSRVGCIMCPNSSGKHEFFKRTCFPELVDDFCKIIIETSGKDLTGGNAQRFLENGGWRTRLSGRELKFHEDDRVQFEEKPDNYVFTVDKYNENWKKWYKTIGELIKYDDYSYGLQYENVTRKCYINPAEKTFTIENLGHTKNAIEFISYFKAVLVKTQYCVFCKTCVAECPGRNISMENGVLEISDKCIRCHECLKIKSGCLYYNSIKGSTSMKDLKGINRYLSVGVDAHWIYENFENGYEPGARKTDTMYSLLTDAGLVQKKALTGMGEFVKNYGINSVEMWGIMLCNLAYAAPFRWYIENIPLGEKYTEERLKLAMGSDATDKAKGEFWNGFKVILSTNQNLQDMSFGIPEILEKPLKSGEVKKTLLSIEREPWYNPDPRVILYSLYKFADACEGYYDFRLSYLMDDTEDRAGISPSRIFGLDRDTMQHTLEGLSMNYPELIHAAFNLDLESISLKVRRESGESSQQYMERVLKMIFA